MEYSRSMNKIGLILYGRAILYCCDEEGNEYMIDELKKDAVFGEPFLLPAVSQHYYVTAEEETKVMFIDYDHVIKRCEKACHHHSQMVSNLLQMTAHAVQAANGTDLCIIQNHDQKEITGISEQPFQPDSQP